MLWDCDHCETRALLAKSQRHCAECGAPQNPDKRYFPSEGEAKRVDGHQYEGSDRHCPACNTPQSAKGHNCTHCGAPLDGSKEVRGVASAPPPPVNKRRRQWVILAVVVAIGLIVLAIWFVLFRTKAAQMTITAHRWERAIAVEEYGEKQGAEWRDKLPSDARDVSCHQKERSKRKVDTGEEDCRTSRKDNKDGTYEQIKTCTPIYRSEPVDDDWCRYTVHRWRPLEPIKTTGIGMSPVWPTANLPPADARAALGAKRQGQRTSTWILEVGTQTCEVSEATWTRYADGQEANVEVRARSGDVVCSSL
jgi:hypothetical protein